LQKKNAAIIEITLLFYNTYLTIKQFPLQKDLKFEGKGGGRRVGEGVGGRKGDPPRSN
jgi:hypothetical protein